MLIERNIAPFVVFDQEPLFAALVKLNQNKSGLVVATTEKGRLVGTLSDGDIRRRLIESEEIDLQTPIARIANPHHQRTSQRVAAASGGTFSDRICIIPLLDEYDRVVAIAVTGMNSKSQPQHRPRPAPSISSPKSVIIIMAMWNWPAAWSMPRLTQAPIARNSRCAICASITEVTLMERLAVRISARSTRMEICCGSISQTAI